MIGQVILMLGLWACGGSEAEPSSQKSTDPKAIEQAEVLFGHYEALRVLLVNDRSEGYTVPLDGLISSCSTLTKISRCDDIAAAAAKLKANDLSDLETARKDFGDLSQSMVALVSDVPELKSKLHVFSCPMAQDYPNWVQPTAQLENPYMGQRMLKCGKAVDWSDL